MKKPQSAVDYIINECVRLAAKDCPELFYPKKGPSLGGAMKAYRNGMFGYRPSPEVLELLKAAVPALFFPGIRHDMKRFLRNGSVKFRPTPEVRELLDKVAAWSLSRN